MEASCPPDFVATLTSLGLACTDWRLVCRRFRRCGRHQRTRWVRQFVHQVQRVQYYTEQH